ncbi:transposase [Patescibacteria group bacterium]|nr:transposase [Patescibacteria group bacterium]
MVRPYNNDININYMIHNRKSYRLKNYDYSSNGYYFITICTKDMIKHFGEIINEKMILNWKGKTVEACWKNIENHYGFVENHEFIIMPDHIHGILKINNIDCRDAPWCVRTMNDMNCFKLKKNSISLIINHFKGAVSKKIRLKYQNFIWQGRFHDHIIRNEESLINHINYIRDNPKNYKNE